MWKAYSMALKKYITAGECSYSDTSKLQIKCPYCYQPVMLRKGDFVEPYFAHYSTTKTYSLAGLNSNNCPNRIESNGYGLDTIENFFESHNQGLIVQFANFAPFFDEFIGYQKPYSEYIFDQTKLKDLLKVKAEKGNKYAEELFLPQMREFFNITLYHYIYTAVSYRESKQLAFDSVINKLTDSYLKILEGLAKCYKDKTFNFAKEGRKYKEFYNINFGEIPKVLVIKNTNKKNLQKNRVRRNFSNYKYRRKNKKQNHIVKEKSYFWVCPICKKFTCFNTREAEISEHKKQCQPRPSICLSCCHYVKDNQLCLITKRNEKQRFHCLFYKLG